MTLTNGLLYRFTLNPETGDYSWLPYRSLPERSLDGQMVFDILDQAGVYLYIARLLGFAYQELSYDTAVIADQYNPDLVSHFYIADLAANYGLVLRASDPLSVQRAKTKNAVPSFKFKGTPKGVAIRIRDLGYSGYAYEVWVNPGDPLCRIVNNADGAAGNVPIIPAAQAIQTFGMDGGTAVTPASGIVQFVSQANPVPGDQVTISDGTLTKTFYFTASSSPGGTIPVMVSGVSAAATLANLITTINGSGLAVTATNVTISKTFGPPIGDQPVSTTAYGARLPGDTVHVQEFPHNYFSYVRPIWVLSSRVTVHLNNVDGTPLAFPTTSQGVADAQALMEYVAADIGFDILPAHVDVMFFVTDRNVVGPLASEKVIVTESFSVTRV